jgi:hypothetical protein
MRRQRFHLMLSPFIRHSGPLALAAAAALAAADPAGPGPHAVWLGQDEHDYCQTSSVLQPNDIQDLHLRLEGLPAAEEIAGARFRRDGGGEWSFGNQGGRFTWRAQLLRQPGAATADVFLEPSHHEASFRLDIDLFYRSGKTDHCSLKCGRSNPHLFMPAATLAASWVGQEGHDWTGPGPAVGPDGFEDARINLSGLSTRLEIKSLTVVSPGGEGWEYGLNPQRRSNAELMREAKDKSRGSLFFSPDGDLNGRKLLLCVTYANDRTNATALVAGPTNPRRLMPKPSEIPLVQNRLSLRWLGQDGKDGSGRGDVHATLDGLPAGKTILAAALSDRVGGYWIYRRDPKVAFHPPAGSDDPSSWPLIVQRPDGATAAELFFQPYRDESGTPMVLRLLLDDGATTVLRFAGDKCDPYLRGTLPAPERVEAKPGDDLNALATKVGVIRLAKGRHVLTRPLALSRPVTITGEKDSILFFSQSSEEPAWSGAILIGAGNTTLEGFSIRFSDDFRWALNGPGGAALIRTFDPPGRRDPKANVVLAGLDVVSSSAAPPADPRHPPEAPYLARLAGATSGKITGNRFRGGTVDVGNGPWLVADNEHVGTVPGTVAYDAFGGHWLHDLTLERNRVRADGPSGKMWRFFTMNQMGQHVIIRSNDVADVGMRDDDTLPNPNAPEILLTESYRLYFEGRPASVSSDGRVLQVPMIMHGTVRPGSVVSILSGEHAGRYFVLAQPLTPTAFLMAEPLPAGDYAISIAHGFLDNVIERNRIDVRGGKSAVVVLAGNHWNLRLCDNHLLGGGESLRLQATPTENPFLWGWSHNPFLGLISQGNIHEDSRRGVVLDVYSDRHSKTTRGRTYLSGSYRDNILRWSATGAAPAGTEPAAIRIGVHSGDDCQQIKLSVEGNRAEGQEPAGASLWIKQATINGEPVIERKTPLPHPTDRN